MVLVLIVFIQWADQGRKKERMSKRMKEQNEREREQMENSDEGMEGTQKICPV
jgi:hypothetical protein